jgi:hypothetical protein
VVSYTTWPVWLHPTPSLAGTLSGALGAVIGAFLGKSAEQWGAIMAAEDERWARPS